MSGQNVLVDTNSFIYLLRGHSTAAEILIHKSIFISFISEIEPLSFQKSTEREAKLIEDILQNSHVIHSNPFISKIATFSRRNEGLKLPDAIIAASAKYLQLPLITADKKILKIPNFESIEYQP